MADRIKGIVVEIGGDTTKLSDALKNVNKSIKDTQNQLFRSRSICHRRSLIPRRS